MFNRSLDNFMNYGIGEVVITDFGTFYLGSKYYPNHYAVQDVFGMSLFYFNNNQHTEVKS